MNPENLRSTLLAARNGDGGWGYRAGTRSRIEPTSWALLALARAGTPDVTVLRRWPRQDGWLIDVPGAPPNVAFNATAALTLLQSEPSLADATIQRLVRAKGEAMPQNPAIRQDNSLQGWSWIADTFSWVEPTAWCVLLLKQRLAAGPLDGAKERIRVGERLLADRVCRDGGWNYGSAHVYGADLQPYVPTTALALLAMQDRPDDPIVQRSLQSLQRIAATERSAVALALTILCLRAHGIPVDRWQQDLAALVSSGLDRTTDFLGAAMALCALDEAPMAALTMPRRR